MPDMLVKLYDLPDAAPILAGVQAQGITIRSALPPEKHVVVRWVQELFNEGWASEVDAAICNKPSTCLIAVDAQRERVVGFGCYEATYKNYFGPTGVDPDYRGRAIGKALLLT